MKGLDLSFAKPPSDWWQRRYSEGYHVMFQCLWTGGYAGNAGIRTAAAFNLANARAAGLIVAGYANASPPNWWPLATQVIEIRANAGSEWAALDRIAIDLEISGLTMARAFELADALAAEGKRTDIGYTARWFWTGHMGNSKDPRWLRFKLWNANYDWNPDIDFGTAPYGPWKITDLVGEQYQGTTQLDGYAVDLNTFLDAAFTLTPTTPAPTPVPTPEEVLMGKIADDFAALGRTVEAEVEAAKLLPTPIPGPVGPAGPAGASPAPVPAPTPAPARRTYTVVSGDTLSGIAAKLDITDWHTLYNLNVGVIGANPNLIRAGMVLVLP